MELHFDVGGRLLSLSQYERSLSQKRSIMHAEYIGLRKLLDQLRAELDTPSASKKANKMVKAQYRNIYYNIKRIEELLIRYGYRG